MDDTKKQWNPLVAIILLVLICTFGFYCNFLAPSSPRKQAYNVLVKAPLITSDRIKSFCDTGKVVKMELYTDSKGIQGRSGKMYAFQDLSAVFDYTPPSHSAWKRSSRAVRFRLKCAPTIIKLFDSRHQQVLHVAVDDLDEDFCPLLFDRIVHNNEQADVPESWATLLTTQNDCKVYFLPASTKVAVIGTLRKTPAGTCLKAFSYSGMMGEEAGDPPIVTSSSIEKVLNQFR
jgi:hypothetical protein